MQYVKLLMDLSASNIFKRKFLKDVFGERESEKWPHYFCYSFKYLSIFKNPILPFFNSSIISGLKPMFLCLSKTMRDREKEENEKNKKDERTLGITEERGKCRESPF